MSYELLDSGSGRKLERFSNYALIRPCPQAVWQPQKPDLWQKADAAFSRDQGNKWTFMSQLPKEWTITLGGVQLKVSPTDFGHLGVFPEHAELWQGLKECIQPGDRVLNLFAYSGGATLALAQGGAQVCHVDASKGMVDWARQNAALNRLEGASIRWIVDDAMKFIKREIKRGSLYEGILLDPPTFGRGAKGEVFKIEEELQPLLSLCRELLSPRAKFLLFSCHTPGFTPIVLEQLLSQTVRSGSVSAAEMALRSPGIFSVPSGAYARWTHA